MFEAQLTFAVAVESSKKDLSKLGYKPIEESKTYKTIYCTMVVNAVIVVRHDILKNTLMHK